MKWVVDNIRQDLAEFLNQPIDLINKKLDYKKCMQLRDAEWEVNKNYHEFVRENKHDMFITAEWHVRPEWKQCYELYWFNGIQNQSGKGRSFCDFGCSIGTIGLYAILAGWQVTFVEVNQLSIEFLKFRLGKYNLKATIINELSNEQFDYILLKDVIGHLETPVKIMTKIVECLRVGCALEFTWDNFYNTEDGDVHRNAEVDFHRLLVGFGMKRVNFNTYVKVK